MGKPGQSKGGHYHLRTQEWFFLIKGNVVLKLEDITTKENREIEMSFEKAQSVYVPSKVAHIIENVGGSDFIMMAYADALYDPQDTVEYLF